MCVSCSLVHHTDLGNPILTWFWLMRGSLSSLERERSCGRLTLWVCTVVHKKSCLFLVKGLLTFSSFRPLVAWKLGPTLDLCSMESFTPGVKKMLLLLFFFYLFKFFAEFGIVFDFAVRPDSSFPDIQLHKSVMAFFSITVGDCNGLTCLFLQGPQTLCVICWASKERTSSTLVTTFLETFWSPRSVRAGGLFWSYLSLPRSCTFGLTRAVRPHAGIINIISELIIFVYF